MILIVLLYSNYHFHLFSIYFAFSSEILHVAYVYAIFFKFEVK